MPAQSTLPSVPTNTQLSSRPTATLCASVVFSMACRCIASERGIASARYAQTVVPPCTTVTTHASGLGPKVNVRMSARAIVAPFSAQCWIKPLMRLAGPALQAGEACQSCKRRMDGNGHQQARILVRRNQSPSGATERASRLSPHPWTSVIFASRSSGISDL